MRDINILKRKQLRGTIVERLYGYYGDDISIGVLKASLPLAGNIKEIDLKSALYYLGGSGKEYIKVTINKSDFFDSLVWLTPRGVNLAEGDILDVGVVIDG